MWWKLICPMRHVCFLAIVNRDLNLSHWEWGSSPCQRGEWLHREPYKSRALGAERWDSPCQINLRSNGDVWSSKTFTLYNYMTVNCSCMTDTHLSTDSTDAISPNVPTHWCSYSMKLYLTLLVCVVLNALVWQCMIALWYFRLSRWVQCMMGKRESEEDRERKRERKQALSLGHTDKSQHSPRHTYKPDRKCEFLSLSGHKRQWGKLLLNAETVPLLPSLFVCECL